MLLAGRRAYYLNLPGFTHFRGHQHGDVDCLALAFGARRAARRQTGLGPGRGCALTIPMELGLYVIVLDSQRPPLAFHGVVAGAGVLSFVVMAIMLGLRNRRTRRLS